MPFALVAIGLLMILTGINNTYAQFGSQVQKDFSGSKSFIVWIIALGAVGALGYIRDLRQFSHYFMALILISLVLSNKGFFANFTKAIAAGPVAPAANADSGTGASASPTITIRSLFGGGTSQQSTSNVESALPGISNFSNFLLNPAGN